MPAAELQKRLGKQEATPARELPKQSTRMVRVILMGMLGNLRTLRVCVELMESSTKHFHIRGAEEQTRKCCTERQGIMPGVGFRTRCLRLSPGFRTSGYSSPVGFPVKPTPVAWQSRRTKRLVRCLKAIAVEADGRGLSDTASRRTPKKKNATDNSYSKKNNDAMG